MRRSRALALSLLLASPICPASAQTDSVDAFIAAQMQRYRIPGLALAVVRDGKLVRQSNYGVADLESRAPVTAETGFQIASATKPFTSTAVLLLVQQGALSLGDSIGGILPGLPPAWRGVTIRQLMSHTSGLPDIAVVAGRAELIAQSWEAALPLLTAMPLAAAPGAIWAYNQTNYVLLGKVVEHLSKMRFEDFVTRRIFQPAGMTSTTYGDSRDRAPGRATNYDRAPDTTIVRRSLEFPPYVHTAGGLFSTVADLVRWDAAIVQGRVLPAPLLTQAWTAVPLSDGTVFRLDRRTLGYGLGWAVNDRPGHRWVGHSGGGTAAYARFLDDHLTIIVLHNGNRNPDAIIDGIARLVIPGV